MADRPLKKTWLPRLCGLERVVLAFLLVFTMSASLWFGLLYPAPRRLKETIECSRGIPSPEKLEVSYRNARALTKYEIVEAVLHQSEGCLRVGQIFHYDAVVRHPKDRTVVIERVPVGDVEIGAIEFWKFNKMSRRKKLHLKRKLMMSGEQLRDRSFYILMLKRKSIPGKSVVDAIKKKTH